MKDLILLILIFTCSTEAFGRVRKKAYSGGLDLSTYNFFEKSNSDRFGSESVLEGTVYLKYQKKFNRNLGLVLDPYLDFSEYQNSKGDKYYLRAKNSGLFLKHKRTTFTAGLLSHSFGLSQLFSPLNFIDTSTFWSPLSAKTISSPTLRAMYKTKKIRAFVSWLPKRFENIYPGNDSSWFPKQAPGTLVSDGKTFLFPSPVNYRIGEKRDVDGALDDNLVAGLRLKQGPLLSQFLYYRGVDADPTLDLNLELTTVDATPGSEVLQVENPVGATPIYQTVERMGVSLRYTLPIKWRLLYEGNVSKGIANERQGYRESQTHTGGLEWGIPLGKTLLLGVVQLYRSRNSNSSSLGFVSPFRKAYLVGASWDYKRLSLSGGYFKSQSLQISLKTLAMSLKVKKNLKVTLNGIFLSGELAELLSGVLDLDSVGLKASYTF